MRELFFATLGAAALIALSLWMVNRSDNQDWVVAAKLSPSPIAPAAAGAAGALAQDGVRLTNQAPE